MGVCGEGGGGYKQNWRHLIARSLRSAFFEVWGMNARHHKDTVRGLGNRWQGSVRSGLNTPATPGDTTFLCRNVPTSKLPDHHKHIHLHAGKWTVVSMFPGDSQDNAQPG